MCNYLPLIIGSNFPFPEFVFQWFPNAVANIKGKIIGADKLFSGKRWPDLPLFIGKR